MITFGDTDGRLSWRQDGPPRQRQPCMMGFLPKDPFCNVFPFLLVIPFVCLSVCPIWPKKNPSNVHHFLESPHWHLDIKKAQCHPQEDDHRLEAALQRKPAPLAWSRWSGAPNKAGFCGSWHGGRTETRKPLVQRWRLLDEDRICDHRKKYGDFFNLPDA